MTESTDVHKVPLDIDRLCAAVANCAQEVAPPLEKWATTYNLGVRAAIRAIRAEAELAGYRSERAAHVASVAEAAYEGWTPAEVAYANGDR